LVNELTGNEALPVYNPGHPMFLKRVQADINKIRSTMGWSSRVTIEEGLQDTVGFFKEFNI